MTEKDLIDFVEKTLADEYFYDKDTGVARSIMPLLYPDGTPFEIKYVHDNEWHYLSDGGGLIRFLESATQHIDANIAKSFVSETLSYLEECLGVFVWDKEISVEIPMPDNVWTVNKAVKDVYDATERIMKYIYKEYIFASRYYSSRRPKVSRDYGTHKLYRFMESLLLHKKETDAVEKMMKRMVGLFPCVDREGAMGIVDNLISASIRDNNYGIEILSELKQRIEIMSNFEYAIISNYYYDDESDGY